MKRFLAFGAVFVALALAGVAAAQPPAHVYNANDVVELQTPIGLDNALVSSEVSGATCNNKAVPSLEAGFGTGATVTGNACTFAITIGTGPSATGVLTFANTAGHGYSCQGTDITTNSTSVFVTKQTAVSTTTCTIGNFSDVAVGGAWTASDVVIVEVQAY